MLTCYFFNIPYSDMKAIVDYNKEIDFRLFVNKYLRSNEWLDCLIKEDTKLPMREK